jgi:hypothetical protein
LISKTHGTVPQSVAIVVFDVHEAVVPLLVRYLPLLPVIDGMNPAAVVALAAAEVADVAALAAEVAAAVADAAAAVADPDAAVAEAAALLA